MNSATYLLYNSDVEETYPGEEDVMRQIAEAMTNVQKTTDTKYARPLRAVHSKSHGALKGRMVVTDNLPDAFRQGIFAAGTEYGVMLRYSTSPSDVFADSVGGVRGLGLKVLGVSGTRDAEDSANANTQDFLFANHPTFPVKDSKAFLMQAKLLDKVVSHVPEQVQIVQDKAVRAVGEVARHLGLDPVGLAMGLAKANTNILGDTFWTGVPIRYGRHVAKLSVTPSSENLEKFIDQRIDESDENALRNAVAAFFQSEGGEWDVRVQLCTNLQSMPVEDPSVRWSETESPFLTVAKLTISPQQVFSEARDRYSEEVLSFNPWNTIADHRQLGSIMRARKMAYDQSSKHRHQRSGAERKEPQDISEMPD